MFGAFNKKDLTNMPKFSDNVFSLTSDHSKGINIRKIEKMRWFLSQLRSFHNVCGQERRCSGNNFSFFFIYEFKKPMISEKITVNK